MNGPRIFGYQCQNDACKELFFCVAMLHIPSQEGRCPKCGCKDIQYYGLYQLADGGGSV